MCNQFNSTLFYVWRIYIIKVCLLQSDIYNVIKVLCWDWATTFSHKGIISLHSQRELSAKDTRLKRILNSPNHRHNQIEHFKSQFSGLCPEDTVLFFFKKGRNVEEFMLSKNCLHGCSVLLPCLALSRDYSSTVLVWQQQKESWELLAWGIPAVQNEYSQNCSTL